MALPMPPQAPVTKAWRPSIARNDILDRTQLNGYLCPVKVFVASPLFILCISNRKKLLLRALQSADLQPTAYVNGLLISSSGHGRIV